MRKLVFIDDDPVDHFLMRHILNDNDLFDITYTMNASLVLDYIEEHKADSQKLPDLIFLDLRMPKFSGWDFLERMQELQPALNKKIKVYIISSSVVLADKERSSTYPFVTDFINKPVMPEQIEAIVEKQRIELLRD
ncbi:MAG: response regulator [Mucilaginibacter sp.]